MGPRTLPIHLQNSVNKDTEESESSFAFYDDEDSQSSLTWETYPLSPGNDSTGSSCTPIQMGQHRNKGSNLPHGTTLPCVKRQRKPSGTCSTLVMLAVLLGLLMISLSRSSIQNVEDEISELISSREVSDLQVQSFEKYIRKMHRELSALDKLTQQGSENLDADLKGNFYNDRQSPLEEVTALQQKVRNLSNSAQTLKEQIQSLSRKDVIRKYGAGVHRVEIELVFPGKMEDYGPSTFVIELAPLDIMPHSVHFFLDMVSAGLLDGCSFILNALHVLKAAPLPYDGSSAAEKARAFASHGLESVSFKEYTEEYPHDKFTVGFAADGSPSFYINTEDNNDIHAGDPCFGKIVSGFETVKRLEDSPTRNGIWFEQRIGIKHATLLSVHGS